MEPADSIVLALNGGSSSIKFALYRSDDAPPLLAGKIDGIGAADATLRFGSGMGDPQHTRVLSANDRAGAARFLIDWLNERVGLAAIRAVGHRVAHGGPRYTKPQRVTGELLDELRRLTAFAPEHLPSEIALIELFGERLRDKPQVACFDTAFHRDLPQVARLLPLPRRLQSMGIERYGFHGLSYAFLVEELPRLAGGDACRRVVLAHLGNGASLAAVRDGRSIDTSMGFTPAGGIPMSNRSGDLDPGLVFVLAQTERIDAEAFHRMVNHESGLLGVSETSADMRDLLRREANDPRAAEAVALFCYQVGKWIGAYAAALGGVDTLVFSGGIGENAPVIRARICEPLAFLGIELDRHANEGNAVQISSAGSRAGVYVIRTDEERMIAREVARVLRVEAA